MWMCQKQQPVTRRHIRSSFRLVNYALDEKTRRTRLKCGGVSAKASVRWSAAPSESRPRTSRCASQRLAPKHCKPLLRILYASYKPIIPLCQQRKIILSPQFLPRTHRARSATRWHTAQDRRSLSSPPVRACRTMRATKAVA